MNTILKIKANNNLVIARYAQESKMYDVAISRYYYYIYLSIISFLYEKIMKKNLILEKSFDFAVKSVEIYKTLIYKKKEYVLSKQLLRSSTSIGANASFNNE